MGQQQRVIEVPFHIGDFLSGTMHMDATEIGAYWLLCVAHYQAGPEGLPNDDATLARIARTPMRSWSRIRKTVLAKFSENGPLLQHKRVGEVLARIAEKSSAARASALIKHGKDSAAAGRSHSEGPANHQPRTHQVLHPEEGLSSAREAGAGYDVERCLRFDALAKAKRRAAELNRDFRELCRLYNAFVDKRGEPGDADAAFLAWLEKFTGGKRL